MWFLDSGCSRHITEEKDKFFSLERWDGGFVTFGNNDKAWIKGIGTVGSKNSAKIKNVQYGEVLKHNLISISQLCDTGHEVIFKSDKCFIKDIASGKIIFTACRNKNLYSLCLDDLSNETCLVSNETDQRIWHRRAGHTSMKTISKLSKLELVKGLPKIKFEKDKMCEACVHGKQVKSIF